MSTGGWGKARYILKQEEAASVTVNMLINCFRAAIISVFT
jgi:hypothetical protein